MISFMKNHQINMKGFDNIQLNRSNRNEISLRYN